jgi:hypothetical protein
MRPVWTLYASTVIVKWQRFVSLNILWNFDILGKVRKRGMFAAVLPLADD